MQEAARKETARQEAARQETARQDPARQESARREVARQEAAKKETARQANRYTRLDNLVWSYPVYLQILCYCLVLTFSIN